MKLKWKRKKQTVAGAGDDLVALEILQVVSNSLQAEFIVRQRRPSNDLLQRRTNYRCVQMGVHLIRMAAPSSLLLYLLLRHYS